MAGIPDILIPALVAELYAHGFDFEIEQGQVNFVGDYDRLPVTLQHDIDDNGREVAAWHLATAKENH
jgi:hypothetical protein